MKSILNPLKFFCNTNGLLSKKIGVDRTGQPIYDKPYNILVKKEEGTHVSFFNDSEELTSNGVYYSLEEVKLGDKIDNHIIKGVETERDVYGNVLGYKLLY